MLNASIKGSTQEELEDKVSDISGSEKQKSRKAEMVSRIVN